MRRHMMQTEKEPSEVYKVVLYGKTGRDSGDIQKAIQECVGESAEVEIMFCPLPEPREIGHGYSEHFDHPAHPNNWCHNMSQKIYSVHKEEILEYFTGLKDYLKGEGYKWDAIEVLLSHYIDQIMYSAMYDWMCLLNYQFLEDQDYKQLTKYHTTPEELKADDWDKWVDEGDPESEVE